MVVLALKTLQRRCPRGRRVNIFDIIPQCLVVFGKYLGVNLDSLFVLFRVQNSYREKWMKQSTNTHESQYGARSKEWNIEWCRTAVWMATLDSAPSFPFNDAVAIECGQPTSAGITSPRAKCRIDDMDHRLQRPTHPCHHKTNIVFRQNQADHNEWVRQECVAITLEMNGSENAMKNSIPNFSRKNHILSVWIEFPEVTPSRA